MYYVLFFVNYLLGFHIYIYFRLENENRILEFLFPGYEALIL